MFIFFNTIHNILFALSETIYDNLFIIVGKEDEKKYWYRIDYGYLISVTSHIIYLSLSIFFLSYFHGMDETQSLWCIQRHFLHGFPVFERRLYCIIISCQTSSKIPWISLTLHPLDEFLHAFRTTSTLSMIDLLIISDNV